MYTWSPVPNPKVLVLCDTRFLNDANTDREQGDPGPGNQHVLHNWPFGKRVWGKWAWENKVGRVALFEFGEVITPEKRKKAKRELRELLVRVAPERIVVLQSRSKSVKKAWNDEYAESKHAGTICFDFFNPPAPLPPGKDSPGMAGCLWETPYGTVLPILNPQNVDYVYSASVLTWLGWARDLTPVVLPPKATSASEPGDRLTHLLNILGKSARDGKPITFDLESFSTESLVTCVGLSDGIHTVSVPWEPFRPHGQAYTEPGLHLAPQGDVVREIFAKARVVVGHNIIRFDLPFLARKGIEVNGHAFDTYLAHGVTMNQFKHGLQQVVSYELPIPPWKALHQAHAKSSGFNPRTQPEAWVQNPQELRRYNVADTYYNALVAPIFAERVGFTL